MTHPKNRNRSDSAQDTSVRVKTLQNHIYLRIVLVVLVLVLTVVLVFSLTVAWQTNVVQSGGLTFTAEGWNFGGSMEIDGQVFSIAPGDSGLVAMSLKNESASLVAASMTVSKDQLIAEAKNKLYFYVDTEAERNGELVDRVYLGKNASYTYAIFPYGEVVVNETAHNAPALMWEWQYDTLGYYVLGTETNGIVAAEDYIRPIVYEYDEFKTTFDSKGHLLTTDGKTTVEELLAAVSASDGYEGTIDVSQKTAYGYYPVDVDENNYGVWAYLCTYGEIQDAAADDTQLGTEQAALGNVRVRINAQNSREEGLAVSTEAQLLAAVGNPGLQMLTLTGDVVVSETLVVGDDTRLMIDLNGYTLTSGANKIIDAQPGAEVMVYNGTVSGNGTTLAGVYTSGATVTLNRVTVQNVDEGLMIFDNENAVSKDSTVRLINCTITGKEDGLWIKGNGAGSEKKTAIVIEGGEITGESYAGILCNGAYYGYDIRVTGTKINGYYTGIYFPAQDSALALTACEVEGKTGIVVKGGTAAIHNCTVKGTGEQPLDVPTDPSQLPNSGWLDTGDGIYLEANYTNWTTTVIITGSNTQVSSRNALAVRQFPLDVPQASITVMDGTFSSSVADYLPTGYTETESDGIYTVSNQP